MDFRENNENLVDKLKIVSVPSHTSHFNMNISGQDIEIGALDSKKDKNVNVSESMIIENCILNSKVDKDVLEIKTF